MDEIKIDKNGFANGAKQIASPNFDARLNRDSFIQENANQDSDDTDNIQYKTPEISLIVIHNISLPPNQYGGNGVVELFTNTLNPDEHPYYAEIYTRKVSSHFFIRRDGELIQFVSCLQRAWHAGVSNWLGRERCNDFSIGIELEGSDFEAFEAAQYTTLQRLIDTLKQAYPIQHIAGHSDIAPGRKTDPGPYFDWLKINKQTESLIS